MIQESIIGDLRKRGFHLISVTEPDLCSDEPTRVMMRQIFGAIAQYDRAMPVAKLRGARERMRAKEGRARAARLTVSTQSTRRTSRYRAHPHTSQSGPAARYHRNDCE